MKKDDNKIVSFHLKSSEISFCPNALDNKLISNKLDVTLSAGEPIQLLDRIDVSEINLKHLLVKHPEDSYIFKVNGDSMEPRIKSGDIVVVDRYYLRNLPLIKFHGKIVAGIVDGEGILKRLHIEGGKVSFVPDNKEYETKTMNEYNSYDICGVVIGIISLEDVLY